MRKAGLKRLFLLCKQKQIISKNQLMSKVLTKQVQNKISCYFLKLEGQLNEFELRLVFFCNPLIFLLWSNLYAGKQANPPSSGRLAIKGVGPTGLEPVTPWLWVNEIIVSYVFIYFLLTSISIIWFKDFEVGSICL